MLERLEVRWQALLERVQAEKAARIEAFQASGGECMSCFDTGPCVACARGQAVMAELDEAEREARYRERVDRSGLPARFRGLTFDTFPGQRELAQEMSAFVRGWDRRQNLLLLGAYGTGKTGLLAASVDDLARRGHAATFTTTPLLFDRLRAGYEDGSFARLAGLCQTTALLILDDLGAERPTEWVRERLYAIVNHRYEHQLPTWASSNLPPDDLAAVIGERVWWRLQEGARLIVATGPNLRGRQS